MQCNDDTAAAFSEGSDARIAGLPISKCPYAEGQLRRYWREGWSDVQQNYGVDSPRELRVALPPVRK